MTIDLYPAIDIRGGRCVRLVQGDFDRETVYGDDPIAIAKEYETAGARWIHVVDLDAARRQGSNRAVIEATAAAVDVQVQTGGGVRDGSLLGRGVARVVFGSAALVDPAMVTEVAHGHPGGVAVGLDHRDGEVRVRGWEEGSGRRLDDIVAEFTGAGVAAFVVTDIGRDGMLAGPDVDGLRMLAARTPVPVIASGGVGTLDDLRMLTETGVAGVIVGKALYERRFTVEQALEVLAGA
jgi:phosphoribosylformimino-5-aminoimidazole carboxamide ribotide isomerase